MFHTASCSRTVSYFRCADESYVFLVFFRADGEMTVKILELVQQACNYKQLKKVCVCVFFGPFVCVDLSLISETLLLAGC